MLTGRGRLEFHFYSGSGGHSVVSSSFDSPCVPNTGAFFSGYIPGDDSGVSGLLIPKTVNIKLKTVIGHCLRRQRHLHGPDLVLLLPPKALPERHGWRRKPSIRQISLRLRKGCCACSSRLCSWCFGRGCPHHYQRFLFRDSSDFGQCECDYLAC